tara:strand:+ start:545 stop:832 length:288 start_codon:yes stop_codon:yes gene_type:complete
MMENVAVFYLKSGDSLIGELEELEEEPKLFLKNCYRIVGGRPKQTPWKLEAFPLYMDDNSCLLKTDLIITAGEPAKDVLMKYIDITKETIEQPIE